MRLIDIEAINWYDDLFMKGENQSGVWVRYRDVEKLIRNAPTVDAVPVVRCQECKWFAEGKWCHNPNNDMVQGGTTGEWFCADGKRKGGDE